MSQKDHLLNVSDLSVHYRTDHGVVKALNKISLKISEGESFGLVGETGAGKTTTAMSIMQLIPDPPGKIVSGAIHFNNENLLEASSARRREIRGNEISMIFQDPMTALNPRMIVVSQIEEVIKFHRNLSSEESNKEALKMLETVGIDPARGREYPHQFSGGMKQRIVIAIALACRPKLLIADEPTTALDVTIQAQMLKMVKELQEEYKTSLLMITHDLGVVAKTCDRVGIIYAGEIVECGSLRDIFKGTQHPYTKGLFHSIPSITKKVDRLIPIDGNAPDPTNLPSGCSFAPRCPRAKTLCTTKKPTVFEKDGHVVSCHYPLQND